MGVINFSNTNPQVDYAGIGVDVLSHGPGGGFHRMSGTSMACPHVAGLIAAILSAKPDVGKKKQKQIKLNRLLRDDYLIDIGDKGKEDKNNNKLKTAFLKDNS